jgi:hypothetical protein
MVPLIGTITFIGKGKEDMIFISSFPYVITRATKPIR